MTSQPQPRLANPAETHQQIDRIVSSRTFSGKGQLVKLLRILFEQMDSTTLKPDRVIRELWPEEVKTKSSADVATEINRLRKALEAYYLAEGSADTVLVTLPNRAVQASGVREKRWMIAEPKAPAQLSTPTRAVSTIEASPTPSHIGRRIWFVNLLVAAVLLLIAGLFVAGLVTRDRRPYAARLEGSTLIISNQRGDELWRKSFSGGFWPQYYEQGVARRVWFGDINGDRHYEVLFAYHPATDPRSHSSTLICYSDRGYEKWRWIPGRVLPELEGEPATFELMAFGVLKSEVRKPVRIVALSRHTTWAPSQVAILDSGGHLTSEYWHSGHLSRLTLADLDGDGRQEIIATGISNGYHQATMVVLDSNNVNGASIEAARPEIQIHGMGVPHERARLLFPRSDLNLATAPWNEGMESAVEKGKIRFWTQECSAADGIWYELDNHFRLIHVWRGDYFSNAHDEYYRKQKNPHLLVRKN